MVRRSRCRSISFVHYKGGTGKTTSCINVAAVLAKMGKKVLVVDMDPQANATAGLGIDKDTIDESMYDVLLDQCNGREGTSLPDIILETEFENLHLAPSTIDLVGTELKMLQKKNWRALKKSIEKAKKYYDYILIDTPPSYGYFIINGIIASDSVMVVVDPGIFALEGMENIVTIFHDIYEHARHNVNVLGLIVTKHSRKTPFSKRLIPKGKGKVAQGMRKILKESIHIIPDSNVVPKSQQKGIPLPFYSPHSNVSKAYEKVAHEVLKYG